jgi:hypothetical protein
MSRPLFLERPHSSLRTPRTCNFQPPQAGFQFGRVLALVVCLVLGLGLAGVLFLYLS